MWGLLWWDFADVIKVTKQLILNREIIWMGLVSSHEPFKRQSSSVGQKRGSRTLEVSEGFEASLLFWWWRGHMARNVGGFRGWKDPLAASKETGTSVLQPQGDGFCQQEWAWKQIFPCSFSMRTQSSGHLYFSLLITWAEIIPCSTRLLIYRIMS